MKIYIASGFFNDMTRKNVEFLATTLRQDGNEVYVPMEHEVEHARELKNSVWAKKVFDMNIQALRDCDMVVMIDYGMNNDSGASWECGFAYGIGKPCKIIPMNTVLSIMTACSAANFRRLAESIELK